MPTFTTVNIIADSISFVNINRVINERRAAAHRAAPQPPAEGEQLRRWGEHKAESLRVARKLKNAGYESRAERMAACSDIIEYNYCHDCGGYHVRRANLCRDRFCPTCAWRLSLQRFGEMRRVLIALAEAYPESDFSLITLTVKNCHVKDLDTTMRRMSAAWNLVGQRKIMKQDVRGWARSVELTYNDVTREVHPHYHILVMWMDREHGDDLRRAWVDCARKKKLSAQIQCQNAKLIGADGDDTALLGAVLETYKYNIKGSTLDAMPLHEFRAVADQWAHKRLLAFGGIIADYIKLCQAELDSIKDEDDTLRCGSCLSANVEKLVYQWSFGGFRRLGVDE